MIRGHNMSPLYSCFCPTPDNTVFVDRKKTPFYGICPICHKRYTYYSLTEEERLQVERELRGNPPHQSKLPGTIRTPHHRPPTTPFS